MAVGVPQKANAGGHFLDSNLAGRPRLPGPSGFDSGDVKGPGSPESRGCSATPTSTGRCNNFGPATKPSPHSKSFNFIE